MFHINILSQDNFFAESLSYILNNTSYDSQRITYRAYCNNADRDNFDLLIIIFTTNIMTDVLAFFTKFNDIISQGKKVLVIGNDSCCRICDGISTSHFDIFSLSAYANENIFTEKVNFILKAHNHYIYDNRSSDSIYSPKSKDAINLILKGYSLSSVSRILNKSIKTISSQKRSAMNKIGVTTTLEFVIKNKIQSLFKIQKIKE